MGFYKIKQHFIQSCKQQYCTLFKNWNDVALSTLVVLLVTATLTGFFFLRGFYYGSFSLGETNNTTAG